MRILKRLADGTDLAPEMLPIFENAGITLYMAQLFEGYLGNAIVALECLGWVQVPESARRNSLGVYDDCIGHALKVIETHGTIDRDIAKILKKANHYRNRISHAFLREMISDLGNDAGRESVNAELEKMYRVLSQAVTIASALSSQLLAQLGTSKEEQERLLKEHQQSLRGDPFDEDIEG